jgi:hypothetical protein
VPSIRELERGQIRASSLALVYPGLRLATIKLRRGGRSSGSGSNPYLCRLRQHFGLVALGPGDLPRCPTSLRMRHPIADFLESGFSAALRVRAQPGGASRLCHSKIPPGAAFALFGRRFAVAYCHFHCHPPDSALIESASEKRKTRHFQRPSRCRRRDSNPRHADYDSAALTS